MKKLLLLFGLTLGSCRAYAASLEWDTRKYFLSQVDVAYFEHFHKDDGIYGKEREAIVGVPLAAYGFIHASLFGKVGTKSSELGLSFPLTVKSWLVIQPMVYNNFQAQELGFALTASFLFKPPLDK